MSTQFKPVPQGTAPEIGDEAGLLDFRDRLIDRLQSYRNRHMQRMSRNYWYLYGRQHIAGDTRLTVDGTRGYAFRDIQAGGGRRGYSGPPRPTTNYLSPAVEVEMAAQTKRQWMPKIDPDSDDPTVIAAAKVAEDVLLWDLQLDNWHLTRDRFIHQTIVAGTGLLWSYWDETWNELSCIAPGTAVQCQSCGDRYYSNAVSQKQLAGFSGGITPGSLMAKPVQGQEETGYELQNCVGCGGSLNKYDLHPDELYQKDPFGREFGLHLPKGMPRFDNIAPHEFYPDNGGLNTTPENIRRFAIRKVRSLSQWVEERYPDRMGEIQPESPWDLMAVHPILGEWDLLSRYELGVDRNLYDEHVFVDTIVELPSHRYPEGHLAVVCGDVICEWGPLIKVAQDAQGDKDRVPKHMVFAARYKERVDEFWGEALLDQQISPQNRLNRIDMQETETMMRMGSPHLLVPQDMQISGPEWNPRWGSGKIMHYELSLQRPESKPEIFGGQYFYAHFKNARDAAIQDIRQGVGPADIEIGEAPKNIGTTSGLQVLGEQAERRRATRERSIVSGCERAFSHRMQLLWCLRTNTEQSDYKPHTNEGSWAIRQYTRLSIKGQTKVRIEKQAYIDKSIYLAESVREAMADQLYVVNSPQSRKKILEMRGLPTNVNEDQNRQIDHAERQWSDFLSIQKIPVLDSTIDDASLHYQSLGVCLLRDEMKDVEEAIGWPEAVVALAGWPERVQQLQAVEQQSLAFYGSRLSEEQGQEAYAQAYAAFDKQDETYQQLQQTAQAAPAIGGVPPPLPEAPMPPPKPFFLPAYLPAVIIQVWKTMVKETGFQPPPPGLGEEPSKITFEDYLQFRAVYESYRQLALAAAAAQAAPAPAAPGSGVTMATGDKGGPAGAPAPGAGSPPAPPGSQQG